MEGFQWTLKRKSSCLNFYFPSWKLDTIHKFIAAMLCVFIMAILTEGIARLKYDISHKAKKQSTRRRRSLAGASNYNYNNNNKLWYIQTFLQGMNALFAYILMLVIMTYSLELLCCVIMGLMVGYFVFGGELYNHGAGSPCCNFLETEDDDDDNERDDEGTTTMTTLVEALLPTLADNNDDDNHDDDNDDDYEHSCCEDGGSSGGSGNII
ncbi:MAG: hypothetical protein ACI8RD_010248 [Bacillariaceae sp.]|jgi:hypothetical protein